MLQCHFLQLDFIETLCCLWERSCLFCCGNTPPLHVSIEMVANSIETQKPICCSVVGSSLHISTNTGSAKTFSSQLLILWGRFIFHGRYTKQRITILVSWQHSKPWGGSIRALLDGIGTFTLNTPNQLRRKSNTHVLVGGYHYFRTYFRWNSRYSLCCSLMLT